MCFFTKESCVQNGMANTADPDQTAGAVWSGSTLLTLLRPDCLKILWPLRYIEKGMYFL